MPKKPLKDSGKAGSGKALIAAAGGGRGALRTWRATPLEIRKVVRGAVARDPENTWGTNKTGIMGAIKQRMQRNVAEGGKASPKPASSRPGGTRGVSSTTSRPKRTPGDAKSNNVAEMNRRREAQARAAKAAAKAKAEAARKTSRKRARTDPTVKSPTRQYS